MNLQRSCLRGFFSNSSQVISNYVNEFVLTKLDPECGLAQPQLVFVILLLLYDFLKLVYHGNK